jgi:hypothetical protein
MGWMVIYGYEVPGGALNLSYTELPRPSSGLGGLVVSMLASGTFGGLVVIMLPSGTQVRGFKPGRSRRIFSGEKILNMPSFGREVKPFAPCRRFTHVKYPWIYM